MAKPGPIPRGPYTVWVNWLNIDGWDWEDFESLAAALAFDKQGAEWVLMTPYREQQ